MNAYNKELIAKEFKDCVTDTIKRLGKEETYRPFHSALLSDEALFWSRFERSFSTSFGQRVIEEISKIVINANNASTACRQKVTIFNLDTHYIEAIDYHINLLRNNHTFNWIDSVNQIKSVIPSGETKEIRVISDLWWIKDGINNYMSIKTVKPNIDQTTVAKRDLLLLTLNDPTCNVYFGLYYNPYGENRKDYAFNPPMKIFNFHEDPVVLIGKDYWDTLGGVGCYEEIIGIAKMVGVQTIKQLHNLK